VARRRGVFDRFRPPHALAAQCGIFVRRQFLLTRCDRSRGRVPGGDARVFRPCSRSIDSSLDISAGISGSRGRKLPAPIGWGSERRGDTTGACCHSTSLPGSLLTTVLCSQSLNLSVLYAGLVHPGSRSHAPSVSLIHRCQRTALEIPIASQRICRHHHRGACSDLATFTRPGPALETLSRSSS